MPMDMWTIRFAERLRFPRVPRVCCRKESEERGEMLAFAHIPTGPAATDENRKQDEERKGARAIAAPRPGTGRGSDPRQHAGEDLEA